MTSADRAAGSATPGVPAWAMARLGEKFADRWTLTGILGIGGTSAVYLGRDGDAHDAAIKILRRDIGGSAAAVGRFVAEIDLLEELAGPGIVAALARGITAAGEHWVALEALDGATLEAILHQDQARPPLEFVASVAAEVARTLDRVHAAGVVHRDVKPDNIFVRTDGSACLLDFGAALRIGEALDEATADRVGTAAYIAPEQAVHAARGIGPHSDMFALGATLFRALAGRGIREGTRLEDLLAQAVANPPPSLGRFAPDLPVGVIGAVDRAMSWNPADRWASGEELIDALADGLGSQNADAMLSAQREQTAVLDALKRATELTRRAQRSEADIKEARRVLREAFRALGPLLNAVRRFGWGHAEVERRISGVHAGFVRAIDTIGGACFWSVRPNGFAFAGDVVWTPDELLEELPYALFVEGIRGITLAEGFDEAESRTLVDALASAAAGSAAAKPTSLDEGDVALRLFDAELPHVALSTVTSFDVGLLDRIASVETQFGDVKREIDAALADLDADEPTDLERDLGVAGVAQAASMGAADEADGDPGERAERSVPPLLAEVQSHLFQLTGERIATLTLAMRDVAETDEIGLLGEPVRGVIELWCAPADLPNVVELLGALWNAVDRATFHRVTRATVPDRAFRELARRCEELVVPGAEQLVDHPLLAALAETHAGASRAVLVDLWISAPESPRGRWITRLIDDAIETWAPAVLPRLGELRAAQVRHLLDHAAANETGARVPIARAAFGHRDDEIRQRALRMRLQLGDPMSSDELTRLLHASAAPTRLDALSAVREYRPASAVAALSTVCGEPRFHTLPLAERQQLLTTIFTLDPEHAESTCVEMVRPSRLVDDSNVTASRVLAAQLLGSLADSTAVIEALKNESKRMLRSSSELRAAAREAVEAINTRRSAR